MDEAQIKAAFHAFALRFHPDRLVEEGDDVVGAAAELFKRGVEAYNILIKRDLRERYDVELRKGKLRMDADARPSAPPPPPRPRRAATSCSDWPGCAMPGTRCGAACARSRPSSTTPCGSRR